MKKQQKQEEMKERVERLKAKRDQLIKMKNEQR